MTAPPTTDEIFDAMRARLSYLEPFKEEYDRLHAARTALNGALGRLPKPKRTPKPEAEAEVEVEAERTTLSGDMPKPKPKGKSYRLSGNASREQAEQRRAAFHQFLREHPGTWTSHDLAPILGIKSNQMGPLLGRALARGEIVHVDDHQIPEERRSIKVFRRTGKFAEGASDPVEPDPVEPDPVAA